MELRQKAVRRKDDMRRLRERQKWLGKRMVEIEGQTEKRNHYLRTLMKCRKETSLTAEVIHTLINRIEVFPDKRVEIHFAFSRKELTMQEGGARSS